MLKVDPTQSLVIDLFVPSLAVPVVINGVFRKGDELTYMTRNIQAQPFAGNPTQLIIPLYYDEIISLTCWKPITVAGHMSCFVHCYVIAGPLVNNIRVNSLFAGWVSDSNPISFPPSDRVDDDAALAGIIQRTATILPVPVMSLLPVLGMPFEVVAFRGTFTASVVPGNRNIGLGIDDGAGNLIQVNYNQTNFPALSIVTVTGSSKFSQPTTFGNRITIPLPDMIISNPRLFRADVINVNAADAWTDAFVFIRPYSDF